METQLVIGCGSGRCGTVSLASLLDLQARSEITHERYGPDLHWKNSRGKAMRVLQERYLEEAEDAPAQIVGDVQGTWIWYAEMFLEATEEVRIICMKRPREPTVESILRKNEGRNKWQRSKATGDRWDETCPWYQDELSKRQAVGIYYDHVYSTATELASQYPDRFRIFPMRYTLNEADGQRALLEDFLEIEDPTYQIGIHRNALQAP